MKRGVLTVPWVALLLVTQLVYSHAYGLPHATGTGESQISRQTKHRSLQMGGGANRSDNPAQEDSSGRITVTATDASTYTSALLADREITNHGHLDSAVTTNDPFGNPVDIDPLAGLLKLEQSDSACADSPSGLHSAARMNMSSPHVQAAFQGSIMCGSVEYGNTAGGDNVIGADLPDHIYHFTVAADGDEVSFSTCHAGTDFWLDTFLRVYDGAATHELDILTRNQQCDPQWHAALHSRPYHAGDYLLVVDGEFGAPGSYQLTMECTNSTTACVEDPNGQIGQSFGMSCRSFATATELSAQAVWDSEAEEFDVQTPVSLPNGPCNTDLHTVDPAFPAGMTGSEFCPVACGVCTDAGPFNCTVPSLPETPDIDNIAIAMGPVTVEIRVTSWGNEITWRVDDGPSFGPYNDHNVYEEELDLDAGEHTMHCFDSYGDGWHGGYWSVFMHDNLVAGGLVHGQVHGSGGQTAFVLGGAGGGSEESESLESCPSTIFCDPGTFEQEYALRHNSRFAVHDTAEAGPDHPLCQTLSTFTCDTVRAEGLCDRTVEHFLSMFSYSHGESAVVISQSIPSEWEPIYQGHLACNDFVSSSTTGSINVIGNSAPDHAYTFTNHVDGQIITFTTCSLHAYDTYLRIFDATGTTQIAANDDACGLRSIVTISLDAGNYLLLVEGYASRHGTYELEMSCEEAATSAIIRTWGNGQRNMRGMPVSMWNAASFSLENMADDSTLDPATLWHTICPASCSEHASGFGTGTGHVHAEMPCVPAPPSVEEPFGGIRADDADSICAAAQATAGLCEQLPDCVQTCPSRCSCVGHEDSLGWGADCNWGLNRCYVRAGVCEDEFYWWSIEYDEQTGERLAMSNQACNPDPADDLCSEEATTDECTCTARDEGVYPTTFPDVNVAGHYIISAGLRGADRSSSEYSFLAGMCPMPADSRASADEAWCASNGVLSSQPIQPAEARLVCDMCSALGPTTPETRETSDVCTSCCGWLSSVTPECCMDTCCPQGSTNDICTGHALDVHAGPIALERTLVLNFARDRAVGADDVGETATMRATANAVYTFGARDSFDNPTHAAFDIITYWEKQVVEDCSLRHLEVDGLHCDVPTVEQLRSFCPDQLAACLQQSSGCAVDLNEQLGGSADLPTQREGNEALVTLIECYTRHQDDQVASPCTAGDEPACAPHHYNELMSTLHHWPWLTGEWDALYHSTQEQCLSPCSECLDEQHGCFEDCESNAGSDCYNTCFATDCLNTDACDCHRCHDCIGNAFDTIGLHARGDTANAQSIGSCTDDLSQVYLEYTSAEGTTTEEPFFCTYPTCDLTGQEEATCDDMDWLGLMWPDDAVGSQPCSDYESYGFCNPDGTYGNGWNPAWGGFADYAVTSSNQNANGSPNGIDATDACCACGGGISAGANSFDTCPTVIAAGFHCSQDLRFEFNRLQQFQRSTGHESYTLPEGTTARVVCAGTSCRVSDLCPLSCDACGHSGEMETPTDELGYAVPGMMGEEGTYSRYRARFMPVEVGTWSFSFRVIPSGLWIFTLDFFRNYWMERLTEPIGPFNLRVVPAHVDPAMTIFDTFDDQESTFQTRDMTVVGRDIGTVRGTASECMIACCAEVAGDGFAAGLHIPSRDDGLEANVAFGEALCENHGGYGYDECRHVGLNVLSPASSWQESPICHWDDTPLGSSCRFNSDFAERLMSAPYDFRDYIPDVECATYTRSKTVRHEVVDTCHLKAAIPEARTAAFDRLYGDPLFESVVKDDETCAVLDGHESAAEHAYFSGSTQVLPPQRCSIAMEYVGWGLVAHADLRTVQERGGGSLPCGFKESAAAERTEMKIVLRDAYGNTRDAEDDLQITTLSGLCLEIAIEQAADLHYEELLRHGDYPDALQAINFTNCPSICELGLTNHPMGHVGGFDCQAPYTFRHDSPPADFEDQAPSSGWIEYQGDGVYKTSYDINQYDTYIPLVSVEGQYVGKGFALGPHPIIVVEGSFGPPSLSGFSNLDNTTVIGLAGLPTRFTLQVQDGAGSAKDQDAEITVVCYNETSGNEIECTEVITQKMEAGTYEVSVLQNTVGVYHLRVMAGPKLSQTVTGDTVLEAETSQLYAAGRGLRLSIKPGPPRGALCEATPPTTMHVNESANFSLLLVDRFGQQTDTATLQEPVAVTLFGPDPGAITGNCTWDTGSDQMVCSVTPTHPGVFLLEVYIVPDHGLGYRVPEYVPIAAQAVDFRYSLEVAVNGTVAAGNSTVAQWFALRGPGLYEIECGSPMAFSVMLYSENGKRNLNGSHHITLEFVADDGCIASHPGCTNDPACAVLASACLEDSNCDACQTHRLCSVLLECASVGGGRRLQSNAPEPVSPVEVVASFDAASSSYDMNFTVTSCTFGAKYFVVKVDGAVVGGVRTAVCRAGPMVAHNSQLTYRSLTSTLPNAPSIPVMKAGQSETIEITAVDAFGNARTTGGEHEQLDVLVEQRTCAGCNYTEVTRCSDLGSSCRIRDLHNGRYTVTYVATTAGALRLDPQIISSTSNIASSVLGSAPLGSTCLQAVGAGQRTCSGTADGTQETCSGTPDVCQPLSAGGSCPNGWDEEFEECADSGCTDFLNGVDFFEATCDLDSATDSTADCLAGCTYIPANQPACDLDPATDGTAQCPPGCVFGLMDRTYPSCVGDDDGTGEPCALNADATDCNVVGGDCVFSPDNSDLCLSTVVTHVSVDPALCQSWTESDAAVLVGTEVSIGVLLSDMYGNQFPEAPQESSCPAGSDAVEVGAPACNAFFLTSTSVGITNILDAVDLLDISVTLRFTTTLSSTVTLTAMFADEYGVVSQVGNSFDFEFLPGPVDLSRTIVSQGSLIDLHMGQRRDFVLELRDTYHNVVDVADGTLLSDLCPATCNETCSTQPVNPCLDDEDGFLSAAGTTCSTALETVGSCGFDVSVMNDIVPSFGQWGLTVLPCVHPERIEFDRCNSTRSNSTVNASVEKLNTSSIRFGYTVPDPGLYELSLTLDGQHIQGSFMTDEWGVSSSPINVLARDPRPAAPEVSTAAGPGVEAAAAGEPVQFIASAKQIVDGETVSRPHSGDNFELALVASASCQEPYSCYVSDVSAEYISSGEYEIEYTMQSTNHGERFWNVPLTVLLDGVDIAGSPFSIQMQAGTASVWHSETIGVGMGSTLGAGSIERFTVRVRDAFYNVRHDEDSIRVTLDQITRPSGVSGVSGVFHNGAPAGTIISELCRETCAAAQVMQDGVPHGFGLECRLDPDLTLASLCPTTCGAECANETLTCSSNSDAEEDNACPCVFSLRDECPQCVDDAGHIVAAAGRTCAEALETLGSCEQHLQNNVPNAAVLAEISGCGPADTLFIPIHGNFSIQSAVSWSSELNSSNWDEMLDDEGAAEVDNATNAACTVAELNLLANNATTTDANITSACAQCVTAIVDLHLPEVCADDPEGLFALFAQDPLFGWNSCNDVASFGCATDLHTVDHKYDMDSAAPALNAYGEVRYEQAGTYTVSYVLELQGSFDILVELNDEEMCLSGNEIVDEAYCVSCPAGKADIDFDSLTPCALCPTGSYAAPQSTQCVDCASTGQFDHDFDPATPCRVTMTCTQECDLGTHDADCDAATPCSTCPPGTFGPGGVNPASECNACAGGRADEDNNTASACTVCQPGTYSDAGHVGACIGCPAGRIGVTAGAEGIETCEHCVPGQYARIGSVHCSFCSAGQADLDLEPSTICAPCPTGTYAGCGATTCEECLPGRTDNDHDPASPCTGCAAGFFWQQARRSQGIFACTVADVQTIVSCMQEGQLVAGVVTNNISSCVSCPAGRADLDAVSTTDCTQCNAGTYTAAGAAECTECIVGQTDSDEDPSTSCVACAAGTTWTAASNVSLSSCTACALGQADLDSDSLTACTDCPIGTFGAAGSSVCSLCNSTGRFDDDRDPSTPCSDTNICIQPCPAGFEDHDCDDKTVCQPCQAGEYSASADGAGASCEPCAAGTSDDDSDPSTQCVGCEAGLAAEPGRAGSCAMCLPGQFAAANASECTNCTAGSTDADQQPATECTRCLAGFYAEDGHVFECDACAKGRFAPAGGGTSVDACDACQPGQYSDVGSDVCTFCSAGTADEDRDPSTECTACPLGTFSSCSETQCNVCEAGQIDSDANPATSCTACPVGQFWVNATLTNVSTCVKCPPGKADTDGIATSSCVDCDSGEYCPLATSQPTVCADIDQADNDLDPTTPCVTLETVAVHAQMSLNLDIDNITANDQAREEFENHFIADLAATMCECTGSELMQFMSRITIDSISGGSVVVEFTVYPDSAGNSLTPLALLALIESDEPVQIAGAPVAGLGEVGTGGTGGCSQNCAVGFQDEDCDPTTECTRCANGTYSPGGINPENLCIACTTGRFAPEGALASDCETCPPGTADTDSNTWTVCESCPPGKTTSTSDPVTGDILFAMENATLCSPCPAGWADQDRDATTACTQCIDGSEATDPAGSTTCDLCKLGEKDHDSNPATDCVPCESGEYQNETGQTQCAKCRQGTFGNVTGSRTANECFDCAPGRWSYTDGLPSCDNCPIQSYRRSEDDTCQPCDNEAYRCATRGMEFPKAAAGFFFDTTAGLEKMTIFRCVPFQACTRQCPPDVHAQEIMYLGTSLEKEDAGFADEEEVIKNSVGEGGARGVPHYEKCEGGRDQDSCSIGYTGDRCSKCLNAAEILQRLNQGIDKRSIRDAIHCQDSDPTDDRVLGYYRLNTYCFPCPCTFWTFEKLALLGVFLMILLITVLDHFVKEIEHLYALVAPIMICVTFCQSLALLITLNVPWPPALREFMEAFTFLNLNLELARPECSGEFGLETKLWGTLTLPVVVGSIVGGWAVLKLYFLRKIDKEVFRRANFGRSPLQLVSRMVISIVCTLFVFGSIFYLTNVLQAWNCTAASLREDGKRYLKVEPDVECSLDDSAYFAINALAWVGFVVYCGMFGGFTFGVWVKRDLFEFLGNKFEEQCFYWEIVLMMRKILLMASFLFFSDSTEQAWFLGSSVIIVSLLLHAAFTPYEDPNIDWCEFLSLVSTLFICQSGVLFKVLNDPNNPDESESARSLVWLLEQGSTALILFNIALAMYIEVRMMMLLRSGEEDYKERMIREKLQETEEMLEHLKKHLEHAEQATKERDERRRIHAEHKRQQADDSVSFDIEDGEATEQDDDAKQDKTDKKDTDEKSKKRKKNKKSKKSKMSEDEATTFENPLDGVDPTA